MADTYITPQYPLRLELDQALRGMERLWHWCSPDTDMDAYDVFAEVQDHMRNARRLAEVLEAG